MVHEWKRVPGSEDEHTGVREYTEADGLRLVAEKCKYIVVDPPRPEGAKGRIYRRDNGVWRVRDIMCAILDTERHVRPRTEWFGGVDAHHVFIDYIDCRNGVVSYGFGS